MELLARQIAGGLAAGALYGLMALGLVLIYKTSDVVNFGHGDMAAFTAFTTFALLVTADWPVALALVGTLLVAVLLGVVVERGVLRPARERHAPVLALVVATLGISQILNGTIGAVWGRQVKSLPSLVSGPPLHWASIVITRGQLFNLGVGLALALALYLFFRLTNLGIAMRATAQNPVAAQLMGVSVNRVLAVTWGLGAALGAVAGVLIAPATFLEPDTMNAVLIKAFAAAVIGGFTSLPGAILGGLILGVLENLVAGYIATELKTTFAFGLILVVLALRPAGLLGRPMVKKV
ncbi:MAG: branched-chain amino acid ABC transporter permease [Ardenticatenaceae bacterium]